VMMRPVKTVILEYEDGTTESIRLPEGAGFYRERYTYQEDEHKVISRLDCYEVFWAVSTPIVKEGKSA
jgi:hypothetical protein